MGGLTKASGDKGGGMVSVRLRADEREMVNTEAGKRGETVSQFMRDAMLEKCGIGKPQVTTFTTTTSAVVGLSFEADESGHLVPKPVSGEPYFHLVEGPAA